MFTGIIEDLGKVEKLEREGDNLHITISSRLTAELKIDQSVAHNGVCLTVVNLNDNSYTVTAIEETLNKTNLNELREQDLVNLERAMILGSRLDGHIVQGHVETLGVILEKDLQDDKAVLCVGLDPEWMRYCIPKGSITLDGVSLTIAAINGNIVEIALIPYTLENTTLGIKDKSDTLNIETDIIGKYIDRLLTFDGDDAEIDTNILKAIRHIQYGES